MECIRTFVGACHRSHNVHRRLIGNFDQVWTLHYETSLRTYFKSPDQAGNIFPSLLPSEKSAIKAIKEAIGLQTEDGSCGPGVPQARLNAAGHQVPVDNARVARTTTTLSWSDGEAALF